MRVLLTTDTIGGVWTFTSELSRELLGAGHDVALVSFGRAPTPAQSAAMDAVLQTFPNFHYTPSEAPLEWMDQNHCAWTKGSQVVAQAISDFAPDILHSNQFCFGCFSTSLPVLITAHSDVLSWAESTLAGGIAELECTASPKWLSTYGQLVGAGLAQATEVVAPTFWMARELTRIYELIQTPRIIPNGISPIATGHANRFVQAVTAGRLWDQAKGFDILSEIQPTIPIHVAGDQPSASPPTLTQWLGPLSTQGLHQLFEQSAIYLATSVYEPFGLAPLEAALCGCAVVARDIPSFREVWDDAALYFHSPATLEHLLSSLASNSRRLKGAQCRSRQRAALYTARAMTQQYLTLYERLLTSSTHTHEQSLAHA